MRNLKLSSILLISTLLLLFGCLDKEPVSPAVNQSGGIEGVELLKAGEGRGQVTVMDWNIYVGANVDITLGASDLLDLSMKVADAYDTLKMTNFPERAATIAKFIKKHRPHMIGLQELSLIQRFDGNFNFIEQIDFLPILLDAIAAEKLDYQLADSIQNADVTVPLFIEFGPGGVPVFDYVRLLDADAILVRGDVSFDNVNKGNYLVPLEIEIPGGGKIKIPRGFVSVEATVKQKTYRFVSTHLEAFAEQIRLWQAKELAAIFGEETLPIILVGDFNTLNPQQPVPFQDATYQFLTSEAGYEDTWVHNLYGNQGDGFTSPHDSDLMNPFPNLHQRIDFIFVRNYGDPAGRNKIGPVRAEVLGDELRDRTPSGLWPSDHAGLVAKLHLSSPELSVARAK